MTSHERTLLRISFMEDRVREILSATSQLRELVGEDWPRIPVIMRADLKRAVGHQQELLALWDRLEAEEKEKVA